MKSDDVIKILEAPENDGELSKVYAAISNEFDPRHMFRRRQALALLQPSSLNLYGEADDETS